MNEHKQKLFSMVDTLKDKMISINDYIHDHPETGNNEFQAVELLTSELAGYHFEIEKELAGLPTAFKATYRNGNGGPVIGLITEYDALEELGHGCGHNLQAASITGTAIALSQMNLNATIVVIGTPAEETTSGKIPMTKAGVFDQLDVALMMHGGDRTTVDYKSLALNTVEFEFIGKEAHAAVAPEQGINALKAVLMTFNGISFLREHLQSDVRIHGIITDGGKATNIVPKHAAAKFSMRAQDREYLDTVVERVYDIARGAALATGAELVINEGKKMESKLNVDSLNEVLLENAGLAGAKGITPPREKTGSTDFSIVTQQVPGSCLRVAFVPFGTSNHTQEWVDAGKSEAGYEAINIAAKALSGAVYDLITNEDTLSKVKNEFTAVKASKN